MDTNFIRDTDTLRISYARSDEINIVNDITQKIAVKKSIHRCRKLLQFRTLILYEKDQ